MAKRRVSRGVGRRDLRKLESCCWVVLEALVGCLGLLPLRLMGAEEEEAIGGFLFCSYVFELVWVKSRKICRCDWDFWNCVSVKGICRVQATRSMIFYASLRPSLSTRFSDICSECVFQL